MKNKLALSNIALAILLSMSAANAAEPIEIGEDVRACPDGVSIGVNAKSDIICAKNGGVTIGKNVKSNSGVVIGEDSSQSYGTNGNIIGTQSTGAGDRCAARTTARPGREPDCREGDGSSVAWSGRRTDRC